MWTYYSPERFPRDGRSHRARHRPLTPPHWAQHSMSSDSESSGIYDDYYDPAPPAHRRRSRGKRSRCRDRCCRPHETRWTGSRERESVASRDVLHSLPLKRFEKLKRQERYEEAEQLYRRAIDWVDDGSPTEVAHFHLAFAKMQARRAKYDEAEDIALHVLSQRNESLNDRISSDCLRVLGSIAGSRRNHGAANGRHEFPYSGLVPGHPVILTLEDPLNDLYTGPRDIRGAVPFEHPLLTAPHDPGGAHLSEAERFAIAQSLFEETGKEYAEKPLKKLWDVWKSTQPGSEDTLVCGRMLAEAMAIKRDNTKAAMQIAKSVFNTRKQMYGKGPEFFKAGLIYGKLLLESQQLEEAEKILRFLWKWPTAAKKEEEDRARCGDQYACCLSKQKKYQNAENVFAAVRRLKAGLYPETNSERKTTIRLEKENADVLQRSLKQRAIWW